MLAVAASETLPLALANMSWLVGSVKNSSSFSAASWFGLAALTARPLVVDRIDRVSATVVLGSTKAPNSWVGAAALESTTAPDGAKMPKEVPR